MNERGTRHHCIGRAGNAGVFGNLKCQPYLEVCLADDSGVIGTENIGGVVVVKSGVVVGRVFHSPACIGINAEALKEDEAGAKEDASADTPGDVGAADVIAILVIVPVVIVFEVLKLGKGRHVKIEAKIVFGFFAGIFDGYNVIAILHLGSGTEILVNVVIIIYYQAWKQQYSMLVVEITFISNLELTCYQIKRAEIEKIFCEAWRLFELFLRILRKSGHRKQQGGEKQQQDFHGDGILDDEIYYQLTKRSKRETRRFIFLHRQT